MLIDPMTFPLDAVLEGDVCIVGSGAAGITLALELDGTPLSVIVVEAGGQTFDRSSEDALRGEIAPNSRHCPPHMYRRRVIGGTTSIWGGRCVPLDPIDLAPRDYVPHSGWPMCWQDLARHYPRALAYCAAGSVAFGVTEALGLKAPPTIAGFVDGDVDASRLERFSPPLDFGRFYAARLARSANVRLVHNAQVVRIATEGSTTTHLTVASAPGLFFEVRARSFVIACGGLETPRLLMASDETRRGGIGNEGGALGRYYMCHIENTLGRLQLTPPDRKVTLHFERDADGIYVRRKFAISAAAQRRHGLLNTAFRLHYPKIADPAHGSGILSAVYLAKDFVLPEYRRKLAAIEMAGRDQLVRDGAFWFGHAVNVVRDSPRLMWFGANWLRRRTFATRKLPFVVVRSRDGCYPLDINAEQVPNRESRITLSETRDALGMPRLWLDWRISEQDVQSLCGVMRLAREAFTRSGCAQLCFDDATIEDEARASMPVGGHHLGTARMSDSSRDGVVDRNCAVHGIPNLYVAGGAVMPTSGHANPTLTIVALAIRLAEHLRSMALQREVSFVKQMVDAA